MRSANSRNRRYVHATNNANYVDDEETDEVDESVLPLLPQEMESEDPNMEVEQEAFDEPDSPTYSEASPANGDNEAIGESQDDEDGGDEPMDQDGDQNEFEDGNHDDTVENIVGQLSFPFK